MVLGSSLQQDSNSNLCSYKSFPYAADWKELLSLFILDCLVAPAFQREPLNTWKFGTGYMDAQEWAKERAKTAAASSTLNNLSIFHLPVGVRPSGGSNDSMNISNANNNFVKEEMENDVKANIHADSSMPSWSSLTDKSFEAVKDVYNAASTVLKRKEADIPKKQGVLSVRAASMLVTAFSYLNYSK